MPSILYDLATHLDEIKFADPHHRCSIDYFFILDPQWAGILADENRDDRGRCRECDQGRTGGGCDCFNDHCQLFCLASAGVSIVGVIPKGLPVPSLPELDLTAKELLPAAFLISIVGFVETVSVGHTLAARRRERIQPNQELIGLGAANIASGIGGGLPVTGGFSRSVVNFDAGAKTPFAGVITAIMIAMTALFLTPFLNIFPKLCWLRQSSWLSYLLSI